jgi:RNA polymerase sigma-70 factor (ECF subfamily)
MSEQEPIWLREARAIASRRAGKAIEATDLAQELGARLLERPPAGAPGAWLERLARNLVVDDWRRRRLVARALAVEPPCDPGARVPTPEDELLAAERRRLVRRALATLPRASARALVLRFFAGERPSAFARRLGLTPGAARARLHRGLRQIEALLGRLRAVVPVRIAIEPALAGWLVVAAGAPLALGPEGPDRGAGAFARAAAESGALDPVRRGARAPDGPSAADASAPVAPAVSEPLRAGPGGVARGKPPQRAPAGGARVGSEAGPAVQRLDFEDDHVDGPLVRPEGDVVRAARPLRSPSLIELRRSLVPEVVKSVEDL